MSITLILPSDVVLIFEKHQVHIANDEGAQINLSYEDARKYHRNLGKALERLKADRRRMSQSRRQQAKETAVPRAGTRSRKNSKKEKSKK